MRERERVGKVEMWDMYLSRSQSFEDIWVHFARLWSQDFVIDLSISPHYKTGWEKEWMMNVHGLSSRWQHIGMFTNTVTYTPHTDFNPLTPKFESDDL